MRSVLLLISALFGFGCAISMGPCPRRTIHTVDVDTSKWSHGMYAFLVTKGNDLKCAFAERHLDANGLMAETFHRYEKGQRVSRPVPAANYAGKGHYTFSAQLAPGKIVEFHAYFLIYDPPRLDVHFVCSNDKMFEGYSGTAIYAEHDHPDAPVEFAGEIKRALASNGFSITDLEIADNCHCDNIPYPFGQCRRPTPTASQFFAAA